MTAVLGERTDGEGWTAFQLLLDGDTAQAATTSAPDPTSPGPGEEMPRRRRTDGDRSVPAAGPTHGRWWPRRPTCDEAIAHPRNPLEQLRCVLPPRRSGTCLPNPRRIR